ncbi:MAG: hypothetical protein BroJett018_33330 [Chloroflexota bacterium]|nr:MAG: hypothetical protein BroJett018_33330 [Chloroflexota bacterium]
MSKKEKRLAKLRSNPKNIRFDELVAVLQDFGFESVHVVGSHHKFRVEIGEKVYQVEIVYRTPHVKKGYVTLVLETIDTILKDKEE